MSNERGKAFTHLRYFALIWSLMKLRAFQANFVNLLQINESNKLNQQRKMHLKYAHVGFRWNEVAATNLPCSLHFASSTIVKTH